MVRQATRTGGAPNVSDAYTINGQPGDLYKCSNKGFDSLLNFDYVEHATCCLITLLSKRFNDVKKRSLLGQ